MRLGLGGLYRKRDGSPLEVNQVHARTNNYQDLFEKDLQSVIGILKAAKGVKVNAERHITGKLLR